MKKWLMLGLVVVPVTAMAEVTMYGLLKGGIDYKQTKRNGEKNGSTTNVRDYISRIGFRGEENLGEGLKAIWQVEQSVSLTGNTNTGWSNRETFIGLRGDFGTIRMGTLRSYFDSDMRNSDPRDYDSVIDWAGGLKMYNRHTVRFGSSIRYDSPKFSGFEGSVQYVLSDSENKEVAGQNEPNNEDKAKYVLGLKYTNAALYAKYALIYDNNGYREGKALKAAQIHRIETGYNDGAVLVGLGYEFGKGVAPYGVDTQFADQGWDGTQAVTSQQVVLTGSYKMGNFTPVLSYAHGFKEKNTGTGVRLNDSKYDQVVATGTYDLSKRTAALMGVGWIKFGPQDDKTQQTAFTMGLRHLF
ncbi:MAG: porin [Neisseriaceae bacterium]|nr:porin [Neisseriaceae bacterium]MBP6862072.1 porin [Neisseriaceae bacterium]